MGGSETDTQTSVHFTVGSLRQASHRSGGIDFEGELGLLKAALLYADGVQLISVGASFAASMDELGRLATPDKLALLRRYLPHMAIGASLAEDAEYYRQLDALLEKLRRRRRLTKKEAILLMYLEEKWTELERIVDGTIREWGAEDFRVARRSGRLELSPFSRISPDDIMKIAIGTSPSLRHLVDNAWHEYRQTILRAVSNKTTFPLFDALTGNIVGRAVSKGLIRPSPGAKRRSMHGGLSGDLLQRLPMFERANVAEVLDIREELSDYLDPFRVAVADSAATIESASWEAGFDEEADLVFRERVAPAVRAIEDRVRSDRELKEKTFRYGPSVALSGPSSMGVFLGTGSVLGGLAVLAAGVAVGGFQGVAAERRVRGEIERERLYFYYRVGKRLGRRR